jgi:hypothetical protein
VIKIENISTQRGNALMVIQDIIKWCPNNITINIHSNQKIIRSQIDNPRRAVKTDFTAILAEISIAKAQKMISFIESRPRKVTRSKQSEENLVWANSPTFHSTLLLINNLNLGSINRWCKKIFSIIKTYIICESSSFSSTFNRSIDSHGLEILTKSAKKLKNLHRNEYSDLITFRTKIMSGILPTRKKLNELYPDQYPSHICPRCLLSEEDIIYVFKCKDTEEEAYKIIQQVNDIIQTFSNSNPVKDIWQVIELSCGITFNIFSSAEIDKWIDASVEAL